MDSMDKPFSLGLSYAFVKMVLDCGVFVGVFMLQFLSSRFVWIGGSSYLFLGSCF